MKKTVMFLYTNSQVRSHLFFDQGQQEVKY